MFASLYARNTFRQLLSPYVVEHSPATHERLRGVRVFHLGALSSLSQLGVRKIASVAGLALGLGVVVRPVYGLAAGVVLFVLMHSAARRKERQRCSLLERDLPTLLTSVASSVRAGVDPLVAVAGAKDFFPVGSEMQRELVSFSQALSAGGDEYETIDAFMLGVPSPEADLFKRCLTMSRRHGASLAEPLHRITKVIRQRHSFRRKTGAALAMHRLSAFGIALCAATIALIQFITNASAVRGALADSVGRTLLSIGALLIALGVFWMTRMGREERL
jgi:tight adherence protein B